MLTETQNPNTQQLDQLDSLAIVRLMNAEDRKVADVVALALPQIADAVDCIRDQLRGTGRLFYVGAGTSGRLGLLDAVECVPTFGTTHHKVQGIMAGGDGAFVRAVEGAEDQHEQAIRDLQARHLTAQDVVVGIAASGRTPYVLGAIAHARSLGTPTVGIACNDPSPLLAAVDIAIALPVGAEVLTGSTRLKAGSAQKMVLNMLSTATFTQLGKVYNNLMVDVQVTNQKLADRACRIIQEIAQVDAATAAHYLEQAHNRPKIAIIMHARQVDYETATRLLDHAQDNLRHVLEMEA